MSHNLKKVFETINRRIGQRIKGNDKEIAKQYARLLAEIRLLISKRYEKWEKDGILTLEEMLKFDRLDKLEKEIDTLVRLHYRGMYKTIVEALGGMYQEGYALTAWAVETDAQAMLNYSTATPEQIMAMINNPVKGLTLKRNLEKKRSDVIYAIQQEISQGLNKGESYGTMAKRLKGTLQNDYVKAMRVVRTEGHRAQESAKIDAVEHANNNGVIMMKTWNTQEDSRVRKEKANHKRLNNKTIAMDKDFDDGLGKGPAPGQLGAAGSDINCRCFLTYEIVRVEKPQHEELGNMAFKQWEKERLKVS